MASEGVEIVPSVGVPQILITEPSPSARDRFVVSSAEKAAPALEGTSVPIQDPGSGETVHEQPDSDSSQENSSGEFATAQDCVVTVPATEQSVEVSSADPSEPDREQDFRTSSTITGCCPLNVFCAACMTRYSRFWDILDHRFRIPFWIILLALPLSAGVMGSLYMFSCPAAQTLPTAIFLIGVSLMAVITVRICLILHRLNFEDDHTRNLFYTLLLISTFITVIFIITESTLFWKMDWSSIPGTDKYCDPTFVDFAFWWNCASYLAMVPLFCFPV